MLEKKGQTVVRNVVWGIFILFFLAVALTAGLTWSEFGPEAIPNAIEATADVTMSVFGPMFNFVLGLDRQGDENIEFLMVVAFILVTVIVIGTLDSVNIFGTDGQGKLINFIVGFIVAVIGVRFMPSNLWISMTAPSSALVAVIFAAAPFLAAFFIGMKIKYEYVRHLIWILYIIFMSYLIFFPEGGGESFGIVGFAWVYLIFWTLAIFMLFAGRKIYEFIYASKAKSDVHHSMYRAGILKRRELRLQMKRYQAVMLDPGASKEDKSEAKKMLRELALLSEQSARTTP